MFSSKTLLCLLIIALSTVDAVPLSRDSGKGTLRFATRVNERGMYNIVEQDRARARTFRQAAQIDKRYGWSDSVTNTLVNFVAEIWVGLPPTNYSLLIDTGSANTFVGVRKPYSKTLTSEDTGNSVSVSYLTGGWSGEEYIDTVMLTPELIIDRQSIGVANKSKGINNVDGILGVGPVDLTEKKVENTPQVPTVLDNLYAQGTISQEVLGIYFVPASSGGSGELTFGGYDDQAVACDVAYVPITKTSPANTYWGIDQSITYGGETVLSSTAGIVDTGTTLILLATDAYQKYEKLTGAVNDAATGLLSITPAQYTNLKPLTFHIGSESYDLTPDAQIWPRSLNTQIGGTKDGIYLVIADAGTKSGSGLDFLNGYTFLERFYTVLDTTNKRVGFASTKYTKSESNY